MSRILRHGCLQSPWFYHVPTVTLTLSRLREAGHHEALLALLAEGKTRLWFDEKFAAEALVRQGREDEVLARAAAQLANNHPSRQSAAYFSA